MMPPSSFGQKRDSQGFQANGDPQDPLGIGSVDPPVRSGSRSKSRSSDALPRSLKAEVEGKAQNAECSAGSVIGVGHAEQTKKAQKPDKVDYLQLPRALIERIIGKDGTSIKGIRERSGARIDARDQSEDPVQVLISGTNEAVERAKLMLLDAAEGAALALSRDGTRSYGDSNVAGAAAAAAAVAAVTAAKANAVPDSSSAVTAPILCPEQRSARTGFSDEPLVTDATTKTAIILATTDTSSSSSAPAMDEVLELPKHAVAKVIGSSGAQIAEIRVKTGARIDVDQFGTGCRVRIQGTAEQVALARSMITQLMTPSIAGDVLEIPRTAVGRIIGAGGARVQELQDRSSAKIDIDRTNPERCLVRFAGTEDAVAAAKVMVQELLEGKVAAGAGDAVQTMEVASIFTGKLIGPGGRQINDIQERSGSKVDIDKTVDPCIVRMTGSPDAVMKARALVQEVISGAGPIWQTPAWGFGQPHSSSSSAFAVPAAEDEETIRFDVPLHLADRVLGNGSWVRHIEQKTGARTLVRREPGRCCSLTFSGQPEQVVEAEAMAEDAVRVVTAILAGSAPGPGSGMPPGGFASQAPLQLRPPAPGIMAKPTFGLATLARPPLAPSAQRPVLTANLRPSMAAKAAAEGAASGPPVTGAGAFSSCGSAPAPLMLTSALRPSMMLTPPPPSALPWTVGSALAGVLQGTPPDSGTV